VEDVVNEDVDYNEYCTIDIGMNNLLTLVSACTEPIIINGKQIKSINNFYSKNKARLYSSKDERKGKNKVGYTEQLRCIDENRNYTNRDIMHQITKFIVNYCLHYGIGNIVIGYNQRWKDSINRGSLFDQQFFYIPFRQIIDKLEYKCQKYGLKFTRHEESYTSVCDALAMETVGFHESYKGSRVHRGLFQSSVGKLINADVNGALNILRKVIGDSYVKRIITIGLLYKPQTIKNVFTINSEETCSRFFERKIEKIDCQVV
jgi:IS605 OrfB family transposase